jgi:hypothetical protein
MNAGFINWKPEHGKLAGYSCEKLTDVSWCWFWDASLWLVDMLQPYPLTYRDDNGKLYRTFLETFKTDFGSIPAPVRGLPGMSSDRFLLSYLFHDCAYQTHHQLVSIDNGKTWQPEALTRQQADQLLREMISNEPNPGNILARNLIYSQVRAWGWKSW